MARPKGLAKTGGKPKGYKAPITIEKEEQRRIAAQLIAKRLEPIIEAQCDNAIGIKHFLKRDPKTGKFERLTDPAQIAAAMNEEGAEEGSSYWIYSKDPNPQSGKEMLDRLLDRSKEQEQELKITGEADLIAALYTGRTRASHSRKA